MVDNLHMFNRGVKQAGFLVLYKTAMPGVLIETGFISNAKDEKFLLSGKGQDQMAEAIFNAFREYKYQVENKIPFKPADDTLATIKPISNDKNGSKNVTVDTTGTNLANDMDKVSYRVQFAMFPRAKPLNSDIFRGLSDVKMYIQAGSFKYTSGDFPSMEQALQLRKSLLAKGYKDAFVVAFKGNERISNEEAKRLTEKK
jgi:N-acetylmuramoyl-L-alanine amidase